MLSLERQNKWREQYRQMQAGWRPATEIYADVVRAHLKPEGRLLDLGCGRGGLVEQLDHPISHMIGVDPDVDSLCQHRLDIPRACAFDLLPFASNSMNVVCASWVLEHWQHPDAALREIARVLKPGGVFVFITPNKQHPLIWLNQVLGQLGAVQKRLVRHFYGRDEDDTFPIYYRASSPRMLRQLAEKNGLDSADLHIMGDPTYLAFTPLLFWALCRVENWVPSEKRLHLVGTLVKNKG